MLVGFLGGFFWWVFLGGFFNANPGWYPDSSDPDLDLVVKSGFRPRFFKN
jgi:hypothetical protein